MPLGPVDEEGLWCVFQEKPLQNHGANLRAPLTLG